jgi:hypothetical protein
VQEAAEQGQTWALALQACASAQGQAVLAAFLLLLETLPTHASTYLALELLGRHFRACGRLPGQDSVPAWPEQWPTLWHTALQTLAASQAAAAKPILMRTSAVGPLMRRHLAPLLQPLQASLRTLQAL